jgi:hypothetical protein
VATFPAWDFSSPDLRAGRSPPCRRRPWWPTTGGWGVWLLLFLVAGRFFSSMANKAEFGSGPPFDSTSLTLPLDHVDDDEAWSCGSLDGGAYAFAATPNPWRRFDLSAAAPYPLSSFISNKIEVGFVLLLCACSAPSMVVVVRSVQAGFMAKHCLGRFVDGVQVQELFPSHRGGGETELLHHVCHVAICSRGARKLLPRVNPRQPFFGCRPRWSKGDHSYPPRRLRFSSTDD